MHISHVLNVINIAIEARDVLRATRAAHAPGARAPCRLQRVSGNANGRLAAPLRTQSWPRWPRPENSDANMPTCAASSAVTVPDWPSRGPGVPATTPPRRLTHALPAPHALGAARAARRGTHCSALCLTGAEGAWQAGRSGPTPPPPVTAAWTCGPSGRHAAGRPWEEHAGGFRGTCARASAPGSSRSSNGSSGAGRSPPSVDQLGSRAAGGPGSLVHEDAGQRNGPGLAAAAAARAARAGAAPASAADARVNSALSSGSVGKKESARSSRPPARG